MIAFLQGKIVDKNSEQLILDVNGVGYQVGIPTSTYEALPAIGETVTIQTYHHVTENDQMLFGFHSISDKNLFKLLITVKNIGPKLGLAILSGMQAGDIIKAIATHDITGLSSISGIGKKTAERMVLELKDKMEKMEGVYDTTSPKISSSLKQEALSALESLGYKRKDANKALNQAMSEAQNFDGVTDLVKKALAEFNR